VEKPHLNTSVKIHSFVVIVEKEKRCFFHIRELLRTTTFNNYAHYVNLVW